MPKVIDLGMAREARKMAAAETSELTAILQASIAMGDRSAGARRERRKVVAWLLARGESELGIAVANGEHE